MNMKFTLSLTNNLEHVKDAKERQGMHYATQTTWRT